MGLLDTVIGSVTGGGKGQESGTSPLTKALLLLLAAKAASHYFGKGDAAAHEGAGGSAGHVPAPEPSGKIESGILAGLPSLDSLIDRLRSAGHEDKLESWIGHGENKPIAPHELDSAIGSKTVDELQKQTGLPREQLLRDLSGALPQVMDKLTPDGTLPDSKNRLHW